MKAILVIFACLAVWAMPVMAQDSPAMADLDISLWPEFDRPALLVIYRGQFAGEVSSPLPVEFRIPAEAGPPHAVAYVDAQGQPIQQDYTTRTEGDWLIVSFELPTPRFQLEYYLPQPTAGDTAAPGPRTWEFAYVADYAVATLNLDVQEPVGAADFKLEALADESGGANPAPISVTRESDGLNYHVTQAGPLSQNGVARWSISYNKTSSTLTLDAFQPTQEPAASGTDTGSAGAGSGSGAWLAAAGILAMVAVGASAFWLGKRSSAPPAPAPTAPQRRPRPSAARSQQTATGADSAAFCYQCGARLRAGADFCHQCGATTRKTGAR